MDASIFYISAIVSLVASYLVATRKSPVYGALFLMVFFPAFSVNFLILRASFLAVIQVLVYAGAIMVLYLFVIMLLTQVKSQLHENVTIARKLFAALFSIGLFLSLGHAIHASPRVRNAPDLVGPVSDAAANVGTTAAIGRVFFQKQVLGFELTSVMILIAIIGAIYLTRKRGPTGSVEPRGPGRLAIHPPTAQPLTAPPGAEPRQAVSAAGGVR